ncbi:MAG: hypothetical protein ABL886_14920 [Rhodoglobus sp.]
MSASTPSPRSLLKDLRRIAIVFILVSLSLAALVGIVTLLTGSFGEVQGKIMLTTLLVAGFSITALCHLAVVGRALRIVGFAGIAMSAFALAAGTVLIWGAFDNWDTAWENVLKAFAVFGVLAVSLAHANLLLLLEERKSPLLRVGLFVTVGLIALLAVLILLPILTDGNIPDDNESYWRFMGVVAILDVLGTIVLPVLARFGRFAQGGDQVATVMVRLHGDAAAKVQRIAASTGATTSDVVESAMAALDDAPPS